MDKQAIEKEFETLIQEYRHVIWKVCYIYSKDQDHLNDLYQETLINLWKGFPQFRNESKSSTWVYRIALNSCITFFRRFSRSPKTSALAEAWYMADEEDHSGEQIRELYRQINCLGPLEKALILLWLDEKPYAEISTIMGISPSNVATKLSRTKEKLRKMLNN